MSPLLSLRSTRLSHKRTELVPIMYFWNLVIQNLWNTTVLLWS